ncbi:Hypothetical protein BROD_0137 [Brucella sp. NF 2653]|nr:Hypothetical protein BROD_0137 [Brucella sp. NF 2653]
MLLHDKRKGHSGSDGNPGMRRRERVEFPIQPEKRKSIKPVVDQNSRARPSKYYLENFDDDSRNGNACNDEKAVEALLW